MDKRGADKQEEENDEEFIDLEDISVYDNDPNYEPTEEEVIYYAERLGFDVENDPREFLTIAYQALKAPLPDNWRRALLKSKDELVYINMEDNTIHLYTEIDEMAYKYYTEEKEKWLKSKQEKEKATKVIPRVKMPPLNPHKENANAPVEKKKKKGNAHKEKSKDNQKKKDDEKLNFHNTDESHDDIENNLYKPTAHKESKPTNYMDLNYGINMNNTNKYKDPYSISTKYDQDMENKNTAKSFEEPVDSSTVQPVDNKLPPSLLNSIEVKEEDEELRHSKERIQTIHSKNKTTLKNNSGTNSNINTNSNAVSNPSNYKPSIPPVEEDLEFKKKEYFNNKIKEMKEYETIVRENYNKQMDEYKQKRKQFKMNLNEEYERKMALNKRKLKDDFDKEMNKELKELESELENNMDRECKEYQEELENQGKFKKVEDSELETENKIEQLRVTKESLMKEIQFYQEMKEKQRETNLESELKEARSLIEEKHLIEKKNLDKKYELLEREMELEEEVKHAKDIENIQKQTSYNLEIQEKAMKVSHSKLLDDYQKALEDEYTTLAKTILNELDEKYKRDANQFKNKLEREKEDKMVLYKKEMNEVEREYYLELNTLREENRKRNSQNDTKINTKFQNVLANYDTLRKNVTAKTESICQDLIQRLKNLVETQDINELYLDIESKFEESIMALLDENVI